MTAVDYLLRDQTREVQISPNEWLRTDLSQGEMLWVHAAGFGGVECWAYAQRLGYTPPIKDPDGRSHPEFVYLEVRLDLPEDHPAVQDALNDGGWDYDTAEFLDIVPLKGLRHNGTPENGWQERPVRVWLRRISDEERAERARRRKLDRPAFPELDLGLRNVTSRPKEQDQ